MNQCSSDEGSDEENNTPNFDAMTPRCWTPKHVAGFNMQVDSDTIEL